jgi:phosphatidylglycerol:prolipoprotein diacylglycerol transferase
MWSEPFRIPLPFDGGSIPIHGYGLMILLGFFLATSVAQRESRRRGLPDHVYDLGLVMLLAGILGGRLNHYIQYYGERYADRPWTEFFKIWEGGLVFYGGAIAGFLGGLMYLVLKKLPLADCLDVAAIATPLGMAMGRLGCFLHGCCHGKLCEEPLGVVFPGPPDGSPAHTEQWQAGLLDEASRAALPVHPAQLYQAGHDFLLFALLFLYLRRPDAPRGVGMPLLFAFYAVGRFFVDGLRGDDTRSFTGLTWGQNLSLATFMLFGALCIAIFRGAPARGAAEGVPGS